MFVRFPTYNYVYEIHCVITSTENQFCTFCTLSIHFSRLSNLLHLVSRNISYEPKYLLDKSFPAPLDLFSEHHKELVPLRACRGKCEWKRSSSSSRGQTDTDRQSELIWAFIWSTTTPPLISPLSPWVNHHTLNPPFRFQVRRRKKRHNSTHC